MSNQKDTKKTEANISPLGGAFARLNSQNALDSSVYEFANKKTEKLVTALYMVSDCMDSDDALKGKLRLLGVELLSDMYKLTTLSPMDKHIHITISLTHIYEILSFIEIAYTIGFISEMNTNILKKEFSILISDLKTNQAKDNHFTFTLNEKMFDLPEAISMQAKDSIKRTSFNNMSFTNNKSPLQSFHHEKTNHLITSLSDRKDRVDKILSLVKDLSAMPINAKQTGVSIKEISLAFTNCSEKTIQRELNSLVLKGQLNKTGAKRWSRYSIVS